MNSSKIKLLLGTLCIFLAAFLFACKATGVDTADTTDDGSSNPPPATPPKYTITIDANGGVRGSLTSIPVYTENATVAKPNDSELPTKTDHEIIYWSTVKDDYSSPFRFGETPVTGNITIYPHWRYTIDAVNKMLVGNWLYYPLGTTNPPTVTITARKLYKFKSASSLYSECSYNSNNGFSSDIDPTTDVINRMLAVPFDPTLTSGNLTINNKVYTVSVDTNNDSIAIVEGVSPDSIMCRFGSNYKYVLSKYLQDDSNEILMGQFGAADTSKTITITDISKIDAVNPEIIYKIDSAGMTLYYKLTKVN